MSSQQQELTGHSTSTESEKHSNSDCRGTPTWLIEKIHDALGGKLDTDPASGAEETPIAETRYTVDDDGLSQRWEGAVWLNPPFSNWSDWAEKAKREVTSPRVDYIVFLMGSLSLSGDWFHDNFVPHIDQLCVLSDRLAFDPHDEKANQPLLLGTLGQTPAGLSDVFQDIGAVYTPERVNASLDAFTDGGLHPQEALEESPFWAEKPPGGYASDKTWYLDRDRQDLITSAHTETLSRPTS